MMGYVMIILRQHWLQLSRNKMLLYIYAIIFLLLGAALWNGNARYIQQLDTASYIKKISNKEQRRIADSISKVEQTGRYDGYIWDDPTFAYVTAARFGARYAVKMPEVLQILNVGQADVSPNYYRVNFKDAAFLTFEGEVKNPYLQFTGVFDFSFICLYLMPVLIIVFSYNVVAAEKEQGTWVWLKTSGVSLAYITICRLLANFLLIAIPFWLVTAVGLARAAGAGFLLQETWWLIVVSVSLYFIFWFAVVYAVNALGLRSNTNLTVLICCWLLLAVVVPNITALYIQERYPVPSRIIKINAERAAANKYSLANGKKVDSTMLDNPLKLIRSVQVVTPDMVTDHGQLVFLMEKIKQPAGIKAEAAIDGVQRAQQRLLQNMAYMSPVMVVKECMSALSGTHAAQYSHFRQDVNKLKLAHYNYFAPMVNDDKRSHGFTVADLDAIPRFKETYRGYEDITPRNALWYMAGLAGLLLAAGSWRLNRDGF